MSGKLTRSKVEKLKYDVAGSKIQRVWDLQISGLGVEVFKTNRKSWILRYRYNKKQKIITIGKFPILSLDQARELAILKLVDLSKGLDPKNSASNKTYQVAHDLYIQTNKFKALTPRYQNNFTASQRIHFLPHIGDMNVQDIKVGQLIGLLSNMKPAGSLMGLSSTKTILGYSQRILEWTDLNVALSIQKDDFGGHNGKRDAFLTKAELQKAWVFFGQNKVLQALLRIQILTGRRITEMLMTESKDVGDTWLIRGENRKVKFDDILPLTNIMKELFAQLKVGEHQYIFYSPLFKNKHLVYTYYSKALKKECAANNMKPFSSHILRHSFVTHCGELDIPLADLSLVTGHTVNQGSVSGYNHGKYLDKKLEIINKYENFIVNIVD